MEDINAIRTRNEEYAVGYWSWLTIRDLCDEVERLRGVTQSVLDVQESGVSASVEEA
jgi:hypothetical protein